MERCGIKVREAPGYHLGFGLEGKPIVFVYLYFDNKPSPLLFFFSLQYTRFFLEEI